MKKMGTTVSTWEEVDSTLKRLCELDIALADIDGEATIKMNEIKDEARVKAQPLQTERDYLAKLVEAFCEGRKDEFADKRSRELNFGTVGYRLVKSVPLPRNKDKVESLIKSLKAFGLVDCIVFKEEVDKNKIAELDDASIVKLGLKRTVKDSFRIQPKIEAIQA